MAPREKKASTSSLPLVLFLSLLSLSSVPIATHAASAVADFGVFGNVTFEQPSSTDPTTITV
jgi:hypothetical protein